VVVPRKGAKRDSALSGCAAMASQRTGLPRSLIGAIIKPANAQGAGMAGTNRPASPVGGGAGGAAIGRDVADRQRLAAVFNGGDGFGGCYGGGVPELLTGGRCRGALNVGRAQGAKKPPPF
jgi:hypothetical protein